jgi:hypothetical protein
MNSIIAKYCNLSVARRSIIRLCLPTLSPGHFASTAEGLRNGWNDQFKLVVSDAFFSFLPILFGQNNKILVVLTIFWVVLTNLLVVLTNKNWLNKCVWDNQFKLVISTNLFLQCDTQNFWLFWYDNLCACN